MSDTPVEMEDCRKALVRAQGVCLINGLGLGMLLKNILLKEEVKEVVVIEKSKEVIDLINNYYIDTRVTFINDDAFKYRPPKGKKFDMIWHDIWSGITEDNLPEMKKLHRKYYGKTKWQGSWCRRECISNKLRW